MSSASDSETTTTIPTNDSTQLIALNAGAHSSIKLSATNYPAWRVHFNALLVSYGLKGYVDGTTVCPASTATGYTHWIKQDQLILLAILSSVSDTVITMLGSVTTSKQAWDTLQVAFANKSRSRMMSLKERLFNVQKGDLDVTTYLHNIKALADELAIIGSPVDGSDTI